jgi:hypothetical protein
MCLSKISTSRGHASHPPGNEQICGQSPGGLKPSCHTMIGIDLRVSVNKQAIVKETIAMYVPRPS